MRLHIVKADITQLAVAAIVNAANTHMLGGGGVDGAIHRAAGPLLRQHNEKLPVLGQCPDTGENIRLRTGEMIVTPSFALRNRGIQHIISTAGPIYEEYSRAEACKLLSDCYRNAFMAADMLDCSSVAFPAISCGVYGFPFAPAARIAVSTLFATAMLRADWAVDDMYIALGGPDADRLVSCYKTAIRTVGAAYTRFGEKAFDDSEVPVRIIW